MKTPDWRMYHTEDESIHFAIVKAPKHHAERYNVYVAETWLDLMAGQHQLDNRFMRLRDAKDHVLSRISALDK